MKIMICMGGEEFSGGTVRFGGRIAAAFQAEVSVLYVESKVPYFLRHEYQLSQQKLGEWSIDVPAVRLLKVAREVLQELGLLRVLPSGQIAVRHEMKPDIRGAYEWHVYGSQGRDIRFRVRQGDIVDNIREEVQSGGYDLVILGASRRRRLIHKIVQFVDTSILIVKNPKEHPYGFLLCTDGSDNARRAEQFTAKAARLLGAPVTILSIYPRKTHQHEAMESAERCGRFLTKGRVVHDARILEGEVEKIVLREAREDQVIVLGVSALPEWRKFFFGSTPIRISQQGRSPILIVK